MESGTRPSRLSVFATRQRSSRRTGVACIAFHHGRLTRAITFQLGPVDMPKLQALPTPAYEGLAFESMYGFLALMISGFIFGTFIIFLSSYSKNIMEDKETRLRVSFLQGNRFQALSCP